MQPPFYKLSGEPDNGEDNSVYGQNGVFEVQDLSEPCVQMLRALEVVHFLLTKVATKR